MTEDIEPEDEENSTEGKTRCKILKNICVLVPVEREYRPKEKREFIRQTYKKGRTLYIPDEIVAKIDPSAIKLVE